MDTELDDIRDPTYPTGSYNFIKRLRHTNEYVDTPKPLEKPLIRHSVPSSILDLPDSPQKLIIAIIGAGVGGLANAIALTQAGHTVTVYEQASRLSEVGAGIQIPPNSSKILHSWGLQESLERRSVKPKAIVWRRWSNGTVIGCAKLGADIFEKYGSPYYVTHRAHLHEALYDRTQELGVPVKLGRKVASYDLENAKATLVDGTTIAVDLIIAADGIKSAARRALNGSKDRGPVAHGLAAYRCTISMDAIKSDPLTKPIAEAPTLNLWVGHNRHVMAYAVAGGERYNMVLTHPHSSTEIQEISSADVLADIRAHYAGWDPLLVRLLEFVTHAVEWPIQCIDIPETWYSKSGRVILSGDAAHAMTPYMALGAAMAVEDAAALAAALKHLSDKSELAEIIAKWVEIREPRVRAAHEASLGHGLILHLADGPLQQARDAALAAELGSDPPLESPNQWCDPAITDWAYAYNAIEAIHQGLTGSRSN